MISREIQAWGRRLAGAIVTPLARSRVTPNMLTVLGLLLSFFTGAVIAVGHVSIGGVLLLLAGIFDMFDGALARVSGKTSAFGAFFDSTLDRIAEAGIGLGLLWFYTQRHNATGTTLLYLVIVGSLMISYARARAEGLNIECKVGLMARPERVIALAIGLMLGPAVTPWVLALLAVTTWGTVLQRIVHVWRETDGADREAGGASKADHAARTPLFKRKRVVSG
jgi:CDP-diacylglycerol--glycerol-3-phosphate 3-phosphatidyltransferase